MMGVMPENTYEQTQNVYLSHVHKIIYYFSHGTIIHHLNKKTKDSIICKNNTSISTYIVHCRYKNKYIYIIIISLSTYAIIISLKKPCKPSTNPLNPSSGPTPRPRVCRPCRPGPTNASADVHEESPYRVPQGGDVESWRSDIFVHKYTPLS